MRYNNGTGGADRVPGCGSGAGRMAGARLRTCSPGPAGTSAAPAGPPLRKQSHALGPAAETGRSLRGAGRLPEAAGPWGRTKKHTFDEDLRVSVYDKGRRGDKGDPAIRRQRTTQGPFWLTFRCSGPLCRRLVPHCTLAPSGGKAYSGDRGAPAANRYS